MPIDPSIADLTWLTKTPDVGRDLEEGAAVGGLIARHMEFNQEQALRQQQVNAELAQLPLKQTLMQQDAQLNALKIQQGLKAKQDDINATAAFTGLASQVSPLLETGKLDDAISAYADAGLNNNVLLTDPHYQALGKQLDLMQRQADVVKVAKLRAEGANFRALPVQAKFQAQLQQAQQGLQDALDAGDQESADFYQKQIEFNQGQIQLASDKLATEQKRIEAENRRTEATNTRTALSAPQQARLKSIYKEIDRKKEERDSLPEKVGFPWNKVDNPKRAQLEKRISDLEAEAERLGGSITPSGAATANSDSTAPSGSEFEVGKTYMDGQGRKAIYRGDGNWTPVP